MAGDNSQRDRGRDFIETFGWPLPRPAVAVALAVGLGIVLDAASFIPSGILWTATLAAFLLSAWFMRKRPGRLTAIVILAFWGLLGGLRHHLAQQSAERNDIDGWIQSEPVAVRCRGRLVAPVERIDAPVGPRIPSWMEIDRSLSTLALQSLQDGTQWAPVTGQLRLDVTGHLVHAQIGDVVECIGHLSRPAPPPNPGGFDFASYLSRQGQRGILRVEHPAAVIVQSHGTGIWSLARWREGVRRECRRLMLELPAEVRGIAGSLLIGDRSRMSDETREQFAESGTMHLLAISGLHVGILFGLMLVGLRMWDLSPGMTAMLLTCGLVGYVLIVNQRPPVLRASLIAGLILWGTTFRRRIDSLNLLGVCALVLLLWKPGDLFDIGAQLSFLAVTAIIWASRLTSALPAQTQSDLTPEYRPMVTALRACGWIILSTWIVTATIWLVTLPLTVQTFHLVAPVGMLLNLILIPYLTIVLAFGYLFLIGGLLIPALAPWLAAPFAMSLQLLQSVTDWGQALPGGHLYLSRLSLVWLVGFYLLLGMAWQVYGTRRMVRPAFKALSCWIIAGLMFPLLPSVPVGLRCTFLSVGHGLAVLIELPGGETLLYDAGTLGDGQRAENAITGALWDRGGQKIDAVIISHADHDHYSGLFGLIEKVPVGTLYFAPSFLHSRGSGPVELCELASRQGIELRCLQAGDQLRTSADRAHGVALTILHPAGGFHDADDNANSVVLAIDYRGRRILLTGDLEGSGLEALREHPLPDCDLLLAPHHGGRAANVPELYDRLQPEIVIVSSSDAPTPFLQQVVRPARLFSTATSGAVTASINLQGRLSVQEHLASSQHKNTIHLASPVNTAAIRANFNDAPALKTAASKLIGP